MQHSCSVWCFLPWLHTTKPESVPRQRLIHRRHSSAADCEEEWSSKGQERMIIFLGRGYLLLTGMTVIYIERVIVYVIWDVPPAANQPQHQHRWWARWITLITELQFRVSLRDLGIWVCVPSTQTTHLHMAADQQPSQWQWHSPKQHQLTAEGKWRWAQNIDLDSDLLQKSQSQIPQDPPQGSRVLISRVQSSACGVRRTCSIFDMFYG